MQFLSIAKLCAEATKRGYRVTLFNNADYAEIFPPNHTGPKAYNHYGSVYLSADAIVIKSSQTMYGYNDWFHGPFHPGLCRSTDHGVNQLLERFNKEDFGY